MEALLRDLHFGARMLRKNFAFSFAAICTLALGIGANTAIFTVTNALLLRPFPYRDPQQLVSLTVKDNTQEFVGTLLRYELVRDRCQSFESVAAWANDNLNLSGHGEPLQVPVARVSPNFFSLLAVEPQLGRTFTAEEGRPEGKPVVIISNFLWRSRYGADHDIIGRTITLDSTAHTVVGVLPAGVQFPFVDHTDIWTPRYFEYSLMTPQRLRTGVGYLGILARLRPGTTIERADAELAVLNQQYRQQNPAAPDAAPAVVMTASPLRNLVVGAVRGKVLILSGSVALVLLIACANVASLLLSRALARRKEIAVRTALGASRGAVLRQLLTESMLLAIAAGVLGAGLGWIGIQALAKWGADQIPQGIPIQMDMRVLLFTLISSLLAGIFFGTFPALQLSRLDVETSLRDEGRGTSAGTARTQMKSLLVIGQVALSLLLLIGAGLLLRSFGRLLGVQPGFDAHNVLTMNVSLPTVKYSSPAQQIAFFDAILRRISVLPGVHNAAISAALPLSSLRVSPVLAEGQPAVPLAQRPFIDIEAISPQWFQTMRVGLRAGREFTAADNASAPKVVIVNETFARRYFGNRNPLSMHVTVGRGPAPSQVIGIARDVKNQGLAQDTQAQLYLPFAQLPWADMNLLVRTMMPPQSMVRPVREQISAVDPDQPVAGVQTVDQLVESSLAQPRFTMLLLGIFSATALALSIIGIYGVLSYWVAQRRYELGIRLALGAQRADILRIVVRQGFTLAMAGILIGLVAALLLTRLMSSMLYKVGALDMTTFALAPLVFLAIALLASYLPARAATKVDPVNALRGN
jgi:putative ABC transport system permease protein